VIAVSFPDFRSLAPPDIPEGSEAPGENFYEVQPGDTLYAISQFFNISPDDLLSFNPYIDPDSISIGQRLFIPLTQPQPACPTGATSYTVKKGDTFYSIAKKFKMPIMALLKANPGINPDGLLVGQSMCIPRIFSTFTSETYKIRFKYPYRWCKTDAFRYEGVDGFFQVSSFYSSATNEDVCKNEAYHKLKPYGTHPSILSTTVDGHEAYFILPSGDQPMEMHYQAALIVKYKNPLKLGDGNNNYLLLRTDKNHVKTIAKTLEFLDD
jgi:LysM repeat protein